MDIRSITVVDTLAPRFLGMPDTVEFLTASFPPNNTCSLPVSFDAEQYFVECATLAECTINAIDFLPAGAASVSPVGLDISGDYFIGSTQVIFTVTDPCGNIGKDSVVINITDNSLPTMVCNNNIVVSLGSNGDASIDASDVDLGTTDNCGIDTLYLSKTDFTCADLGSNMIRLTAVDIYGNSNFCEIQVDVTLGSNTGFSLTTTVSGETFFGSSDGSVTTAISGGTGPFVYVWSNNETTSGIANLSGGDYSVVVTDQSNGCLSKDTVTVAEGPKFTVNVGSIQGCQGESVVVPVTVDNFISVSGLSLGLVLDNGLTGVISGITDVNPALTGLAPGLNSIFWTNANPAVGINLPNGTLLFNLNIQLDNAPVGTSSGVILAPLPSYVVLQSIFGGPTPSPMTNFNSGTVEINCAAADIDIAGEITTWKNPVLPIPNVEVALTGTITDADVTALPLADYAFVVPSGANTTVTPTKQATSKSTKINVADLLFIQAHAAPPPVQIPFSSPYQWMAADINGDKNINIADYALVQSYIVNNPMSNGQFNLNPVPPSWKFVPRSYVFPAPNPLNPAPPSSITHNNAIADFPDDDFIGVLLGDVNGDVVPNFSGIGGTDYAQDLRFRLNNRTLNTGEIVTIPFRAANFNNLQAYQLTISFDPEKLDFQGATPGMLAGISSGSFGVNMLDQGLIGTAWTGGKAETYGEDDVLFYLTFRVVEQTERLSDVLLATDDIAARMAVDGFGNTSGVELEFATATSGNEPADNSFALFQNQPNPFSETTAIRFRLPAEGRARLNIYSAEGRLVRTIIGDYSAGVNTVVIRKDELGNAGVYWYELETTGYGDRKKLILID
jgi:FlaG/FlaF family flagellin (archaellin)